MKKLLYSTLAIAAIISASMNGCKDPEPDPNGGGGGAVKGPKITWQTNTGTFSGFTFADDKAAVSSPTIKTNLKFGVVITSDENLKSTKLTIKFNSQPESILGSDSVFGSSTKTCNRTYVWEVPQDKGVYTITAYATDSKATTTTAVIKITAYGPLAERTGADTIWSLKAVTPGFFSAYDLLQAEAITAAGSANLAERDIVDMSTSSTLSRSWKSQNGTEFVTSGPTGKLNGKVYFQFKSEQDIIDAWNATPTKSQTITGIDDNTLIIAKSTRSGSTRYYLIGISMVNDDTGAENDYYIFSYSE